MKIKDGTPKFVPLVLELENIEEIQKLHCLINYIRQNGKDEDLYRWYSSYYVDKEKNSSLNFSTFLGLLYESLNLKLKE